MSTVHIPNPLRNYVRSHGTSDIMLSFAFVRGPDPPLPPAEFMRPGNCSCGGASTCPSFELQPQWDNCSYKGELGPSFNWMLAPPEQPDNKETHTVGYFNFTRSPTAMQMPDVTTQFPPDLDSQCSHCFLWLTLFPLADAWVFQCSADVLQQAGAHRRYNGVVPLDGGGDVGAMPDSIQRDQNGGRA